VAKSFNPSLPAVIFMGSILIAQGLRFHDLRHHAITELAEWGPALVAVIAAIYNSGQFGWELKDHRKRLDGHDVKLESHGQSIIEMKAWKEGYNAGLRGGDKESQ
jgi:hypothetical protein